jgi:poly(A) polymerase
LIFRLKLALASARAAVEGDPVAMRKSARLSQLLAMTEKYQKPSFPLSGADVIAAGVPAGKRVGEILKELEEFWIGRNFLPERPELVARLENMVSEEK